MLGMDKFTPNHIEQLRNAWNITWENCGVGAPYKFDVEEVIAELTHKWTPQVGEVCYWSTDKMEEYFDYVDNDVCNRALKNSNCRPLNTTEVPAWARDKECLEVAIEAMEKSVFHHNIMWIQTAIAKIKEIQG